MTPKEKAIELINKFKPTANGWDEDELKNATKAALICAKECKNAAYLTASPIPEKTGVFWSEVIKEIEKL